MANVIKVPETVEKRLSEQVPRYQKLLKEAHARGDKEGNTGKIVVNMLSEVFGFNEFKDLDLEYTIGEEKYECDVAVKIDRKVRYLVEIKAIGVVKLAGKHISQVEAYGFREGIQWVVLTNGIRWQVYRVWQKGRAPNKKLTREQICDFDFREMKPRNKKDQETLFMLCKRGVNKALFEEVYERQQVVNKHTIAATLMMSDEVHKIIARELKKLEQNTKPDKKEIAAIITNEIITPLDFDNEKTEEAVRKVKKMQRKSATEKAARAANENKEE